MSTSAEQINQLIGGYTDLKAYFEGQRDDWEARVAAAEASFTAWQNGFKPNRTFGPTDYITTFFGPTFYGGGASEPDTTDFLFATIRDELNWGIYGAVIDVFESYYGASRWQTRLAVTHSGFTRTDLDGDTTNTVIIGAPVATGVGYNGGSTELFDTEISIRVPRYKTYATRVTQFTGIAVEGSDYALIDQRAAKYHFAL